MLVKNVGGPASNGPHGSFLDVDDLTWARTPDFNLLSVVRVNTVSPGPVRTPLWESEGSLAVALAAQGGGGSPRCSSRCPEAMGLSTGRFASPEEVAHLVLLLASPLSVSTTGSEMSIDSGLSKALWTRRLPLPRGCQGGGPVARLPRGARARAGRAARRRRKPPRDGSVL